MTLIAFATYGDHAELIADTAGYTSGGRRFGHSTKFDVLAHIDAVLATGGDHQFGVLAKSSVGTAVLHDFDSLATNEAPGLLREAWQASDAEKYGNDGNVFLIGYSVAAGEFVAYRYLAEHDFEQEPVAGLHILPAPLSVRPQDFELARMRALNLPEGFEEGVFTPWEQKPEAKAPTDLTGWWDIASAVRLHRAMNPPPLKVFVAGKLLHCRIERGAAKVITLREFDDRGEELDQLVAGTLHPRAQMGPCACGSGKPALECHLAQIADDECCCGYGEGKTFRECCMITDAEREEYAGDGRL